MTPKVYDTLPDEDGATLSLPAWMSRLPLATLRGVRLSRNSAWDRLWSRLLREVGDE